MTNVNRWFVWVVVGCLSVVGAIAAGQTPTEGVGYRAPRTTDGFPDISGIWRNDTLTPLERPVEIG
ncbi:MAG: hypothetical protein VYE68_01965 [Acidobacteriota bacterium]|nr:hypothetical protein [Acidobacteriota bacterium]